MIDANFRVCLDACVFILITSVIINAENTEPSGIILEPTPDIRIFGSYNLAFMTLEEWRELVESSSVLVNTRGLLRPRPEYRGKFTAKTEDGELLVDFLNRMIPMLHHSIAPNELVVVVIKRDSIERIYTSVREKVSAEACKEITLSPGDVVALGLR